MMTPAAGFAIASILLAAVACLAGSRTGARVAVAVSTLLLPLPFFVQGHPIFRGLLAFVMILIWARAIDYASGIAPGTFMGRLAASMAWLAFVDVETRVRCARFFDRGAALRFIGAAVAGVAACAAWSLVESWPIFLRYVLRSALAGTLILAFAESLSRLVEVVSGGLGARLEPIHDEPHRSRTITEFWSRRWNLAAARWFRRHCFVPVLPRGVTMALVSLFSVSALMHAYLIVAVDRMAALSWALFFVLQPLVILAERRLRVRAWVPAAGRIWTLTVLIALLPLLVRPVLPLFDTSL